MSFLRNFFSSYGLPNSDSANAVRHTFLKVSDLFGKSEFANPLSDFYHGKMGCRIPIRQMPSGILFLKNCVLFGKCYGLPNSDSANAVRHIFFQRSPTFLANRNLPTHYRTSTFVNGFTGKSTFRFFIFAGLKT